LLKIIFKLQPVVKHKIPRMCQFMIKVTSMHPLRKCIRVEKRGGGGQGEKV
jgi:hypothetical protein